MIPLLLLSCNSTTPDVPDSEPDPEHEFFQLDWATRMEPDRSIVTLNDIQQYNDIIIMSGEEESKLTTFYLFNKEDGDLIEKTTIPDAESVGEPGRSAISGDIYIVEGAYGLLGYNLDAQKVDWKIANEDLGAWRYNMQLNNDRLFLFTLNDDTDIPTTFEINPLTGEFDVFFTIDSIGAFSLPQVYQGPEFENEVAFMAYYPQLGTTPPQLASQDMIAVDVVTKEILWRTTDFSQKFPCNYQLPPVVYENVVMIGGDWSIYGFDIKTGEQLWRTEVDPDGATGVFARTEHLLHDGLLYVNSFVYPLACIDPLTGEMLWRSLDAPNCARKMHYNEEHDWIVVTSIGRGSVLVFDAFSGDLLHREHRYEDKSFSSNVIYDKNRDMYFGTSHAHTMGFKLVPE